jgi:effector-binding domain-containing protein
MTTLKKYMIVIALLATLLLMFSYMTSYDYKVKVTSEIDIPGNVIFNAIADIRHQSDINTKAVLDTSFRLKCTGKNVFNGSSCDYTSTRYGNGVLRIKDSNHTDSIVYEDEQGDGNTKIFRIKLIFKDVENTLVIVEGSGRSGFISNLWNFIHRWKLKKQIHHNMDNLAIFVKNRFNNKIYHGYKVNETVPDPKFFISLRSNVAKENMQQYYTNNISALYQKALENKVPVHGMPCGLYYSRDEENKLEDMAAALPTPSEINLSGTESVSLPSKTALIIEYKGALSNIGMAYLALDEYMQDHQLRKEAPIIEEYITNPLEEPNPDLWVTNIIYYISKIK